MGNSFSVGFSRVDITPPLGVPMAGYTFLRKASAIRDNLELNALAVSDGTQTTVILAADLLDLQDNELALTMRKRIAEVAHVPVEAVYFHCTHTHLSPAFGKADPNGETSFDGDTAYCEDLIAKACAAAKAAVGDLSPATIAIGRAEARRISFIRRFRMKDGSVKTNPGFTDPNVVGPLGEPDESLQLIRFRRTGAPDIALVNFQTHPDTVGGLLYHADWPGDLRATFEKALGDGTRLFFMSGAQGDTNHFQVLGENPFWKDHPFSDYHAYMGRAVAGAALEVWDRTQPVEAAGGIRGVITPTRVASNRPDAARIEAIRLFDAGRKDEIRGFGSMEIMSLCDKNSRARQLMNGPDWFEMPVSALSVGGVLAFAGFPGEPFTEIGSKVKAGSPFPMTFVGCLVNDSFGYLPSSSAAKEGGYEVVSSRFGATCGDTLVRVQLENLASLYKARWMPDAFVR